jgi:hypothetical protein
VIAFFISGMLKIIKSEDEESDNLKSLKNNIGINETAAKAADKEAKEAKEKADKAAKPDKAAKEKNNKSIDTREKYRAEENLKILDKYKG